MLNTLVAFVFWAIVTSLVRGAEGIPSVPVIEVGEGKLKVGQVDVDSKRKMITFPAVTNMRDGTVEYLVVSAIGKVHESLLRTDVEPFHIHTAMLLLGSKVATNAAAATFFDAKKDIPGQKVKIEVQIPVPAQKLVEIETLLLFAESKRRVKTNDVEHWIYNGSRFSEAPGLEPVAAGAPARQHDSERESQKVFMAQREGSIVSLIADPNALVNNPRKDRDNDELWILNPDSIPAVGTPVQVTFTLE